MIPDYEKEKMMLDNKRISIWGKEYRLSIIKNIEGNYEAYLSDCNSEFSAEKTFYSLEEIEDSIFRWIKEMNACNNPETRVFERLKQWDGVVRI